MDTNLPKETIPEPLRDNTISAEAQHKEEEKAQLNALVHRLLIIGLIISTSLMILGLVLDLFFHRDAPTSALGLTDALQQVIDLNPSGFLTLGIVVLIATPIVRVIGSILTFLYERDWRYAFITSIVFTIVMTSIITGRG